MLYHPPKSCLIPGLLTSLLKTTAEQQTPLSEAFWGFCTPFEPSQESGICFWNSCTTFGIWSPLRAPSTFPEKHIQSTTKKISQFLKGAHSNSLVLSKPQAWFDAITSDKKVTKPLLVSKLFRGGISTSLKVFLQVGKEPSENAHLDG